MIKELNGVFRRVYRAPGGMYGIELVTIEKGKVISTEIEEATFPTITLSKLGKQCFNEAAKAYDKATQVI